jgi:pimeloyl-ACP methyl ester carboxylesterase
MTYAPVDGLQLYYEIRGSGRPLVLLHGGLMTIDLNFGPQLEPLAARRQVIAVELQGHGHTADTDRPMTIDALAEDVVALLDHLGIAEADLFSFSLGGLVAYAVALGAPTRVGKLIVASADAHRPPGRESAPLDDDRMPTPADRSFRYGPSARAVVAWCQAGLCRCGPSSSLAGMVRGLSSFSACSAPVTGRPAGFSSPTWTSTQAWSQ